MIKQVLAVSAALAVGAVSLQWIEYKAFVRLHPNAIYAALFAAGFLALGVYVGARVTTPRSAQSAAGNPAAQAALGISIRELDVLRELAAGRSNKEIAQRLSVSPNTIKTHVGRIFEKLGARRRTEAIAKARDLGLIG